MLLLGMKFLYSTLINALLFYFIVSVFSGGIKIAGGSNILSNIIAGLLFGALIAAIPTILGFFKLPVTWASTLLMCLILAFAFYFLLFTGFAGLGAIAPTTIVLGIGSAVIALPTAIQTMVAATVFTAISIVGLDSLQKK
jgi:hypothetical protein